MSHIRAVHVVRGHHPVKFRVSVGGFDGEWLGTVAGIFLMGCTGYRRSIVLINYLVTVDCSYNLNISPIATVTLDMVGL